MIGHAYESNATRVSTLRSKVLAINASLTANHVERAGRAVSLPPFEEAQKLGDPQVEMDGHLVEVPTYAAAKRLLSRAEQFGLRPRR